MAEKSEYYIRISGQLIEVTKDVYLAYYRMERRARHLEEKDNLHGKVLYSDMDTDETVGEDAIPDLCSPSVEEIVVLRLMREKLRQCLTLLDAREEELIRALFYQGKSEREYAAKLGISQKGVNKRKQKIMDKLRKMMDK